MKRRLSFYFAFQLLLLLLPRRCKEITPTSCDQIASCGHRPVSLQKDNGARRNGMIDLYSKDSGGTRLIITTALITDRLTDNYSYMTMIMVMTMACGLWLIFRPVRLTLPSGWQRPVRIDKASQSRRMID